MSFVANTAKSPQIFMINGVIGSGKTTLGRAVAERIGAHFMDGDSFRDYSQPWAKDALPLFKRLMAALDSALDESNRVIISYPLRNWDWLMLQQGFGELGARGYCITLSVSAEKILTRERRFSEDEIARMKEMIELGYGQREFSDVVLDCNDLTFDEAEEALETTCRNLGTAPRPKGAAGRNSVSAAR